MEKCGNTHGIVHMAVDSKSNEVKKSISLGNYFTKIFDLYILLDHQLLYHDPSLRDGSYDPSLFYLTTRLDFAVIFN